MMIPNRNQSVRSAFARVAESANPAAIPAGAVVMTARGSDLVAQDSIAALDEKAKTALELIHQYDSHRHIYTIKNYIKTQNAIEK